MIVPRPLVRPAVVGGLLAIFAAGCASEVDLSSLRKEQRDLARRLADTRADVESLRVQVSRLRGQIEERGQRRASTPPPPATDIEERLRILESNAPRTSDQVQVEASSPGSVPPGSLPPGSEFGSTAPPPPPPPPVSVASETGGPVAVETDFNRSTSEEYRTGLMLVQRGEQQKAVQTLRSFVNKNPKADVVPYAQYWIGEAYYGQGKYNEAILAYNEVLVGSPKSDRVPAALLRQASAFAELGDKIDARLILQKLITEHPASPEAARGKRQLSALGS